MIDPSALLYLVSGARIAAGRLHHLVPELVRAGVDLIQLREKEMEAGELLRVAAPIAIACREAGVPFIVNDRPDLTVALAADGVHVGQEDVPVEAARAIVGERIVGLSTHAREEILRAERSSADYIAVGPVYETPTKPGRASVGLELLRCAADTTSKPWFAIGGIDVSNLDDILATGATRIVVVRAITEAKDPVAAAAALKARLTDR